MQISALEIFGCPALRTPPQEIIQKGMQRTMAYMRHLAEGSVAVYRTKLMYVGLGGAGKTRSVS